jgi:hypothetical protein
MGTGDLPLDPRCSRMPVSREQEGCQRRSTRAIDDQPAVRAPPEGDSRRGHRCTRVDIELPVGRRDGDQGRIKAGELAPVQPCTQVRRSTQSCSTGQARASILASCDELWARGYLCGGVVAQFWTYRREAALTRYYL